MKTKKFSPKKRTNTDHLSQVSEVGCNKHPMILLFGSPGIGKTSCAASFPNPLFLMTSKCVPVGLELPALMIESIEQCMEILREVAGKSHDYETLVIDCLSSVQNFIHEEILTQSGRSALNELPFGSGYEYAMKRWQEFLFALQYIRTHKKMTIILIGHSKQETFNDLINGPYDRYTLDINRKYVNEVEKIMDAIIFIAPDFDPKKEDGTKPRTICFYTKECASHIAKNRYNMPPKLEFEKGRGYMTLSRYLPQPEPDIVSDDEEEAPEEEDVSDLEEGALENDGTELEPGLPDTTEGYDDV